MKNTARIKYCPSTLKEGYSSYSPKACRHLFNGRKVSHTLPYLSPANNDGQLFVNNQQRISISGVQEKFSVLLEKNKLRLIEDGEQGQYILKPIPQVGKRADQMPANEHLSMQIAQQVFGIETAGNALIFFKDGTPAYITKRFDVQDNGSKLGQEDFASLAKRTPQTHGKDFKYLGNYGELFILLKKYCPAYIIESLKLFKVILFNYIISNGDAHFKNFSLLETSLGDYKLSPAYDLLNSRIHIDDTDFALTEGLLPPSQAQGKITEQFYTLGKQASIPEKMLDKLFHELPKHDDKVKKLIAHSFLDEKTKRNYLQAYQTRVNKLLRGG